LPGAGITPIHNKMINPKNALLTVLSCMVLVEKCSFLGRHSRMLVAGIQVSPVFNTRGFADLAKIVGYL
jgi:hypothetical protein